MDDTKKMNKLKQLVQDAVDFRRSQRDDEYLTNEAHYEGLHWSLANFDEDSPFLLKSDINHLKNAVDLRLGSLSANTYYGELLPQSPDDVEAIEELNVIYKNEWFRLNIDDILEKCVRDGAIFDNGYLELNFDPDTIVGGTNKKREGAVTAKYLAAANVYLDPTADSLDDCEYIVVNTRRTKSWMKRNKPDWYEKLTKNTNNAGGMIDAQDAGYIFTGRDYNPNSSSLFLISTLYVKELEDVELDSDEENKDSKDTKKKSKKKDSKKETVSRTRIKIYYLCNDVLLEESEDYPFDEFPIIAFQWQELPQTPYGIPLLRGLTVPQKVANLIESAANNIAMHYTVPTWIVASDSGLDIDEVAKLSAALGMVWKVDTDPNTAIKQLDPPQINAELVAIKDSFVANIFQYAGATNAYQGDIGTAGSTAEGTLAAISRATIIDNDPLKQIKKFVEKVTRLLIKFMARYYKNETIYIREKNELDQNNRFSWKEAKMPDNASVLNYDFEVDLASRSKTDKNRQYNLLKELYQLQQQYKDKNQVINIPDLVKAAQLDNYTEMFKRLSNMTEEAFAEKADLIVQIMTMARTTTPNGQPLIPAELVQQGIIDVLDDNNELTTVEQIFDTYEQYETQITQLKQQEQQQAYQQEINSLQNSLVSADTLNNALQALTGGVQNSQQDTTQSNVDVL